MISIAESHQFPLQQYYTFWTKRHEIVFNHKEVTSTYTHQTWPPLEEQTHAVVSFIGSV